MDNGEKIEQNKNARETGIYVSVLNSKPFSNDVSHKFDRKNYTDKAKMDTYKEKYFKGKQTAEDEFTKQTLHLKQNAARNKYKSNASKHMAETDHTVSEKNAYEFGKKLPNITDDDIKKAVNRKYNFKVRNARDNRSKQDVSDTKYMMKQVEKAVKSDLPLDKKVDEVKEIVKTSGKTITNNAKAQIAVKGELVVKSVGREIKSDAPEVLSTAIGINIGRYINGEITLPEAAVNSVKDAANIEARALVIKGGVKIAQSGLEQLAESAVSDAVTQGLNIVAKNAAGIATVALICGKSVIRCASGEITPSEMAEELCESAVSLVCMKIGSAVGEAALSFAGPAGIIIGKIVGTAIGYLVSAGICSVIQEIKEDKKREELTKLYKELTEKARREREELEMYLEKVHARLRENIISGFEQIKEGILSKDTNKVSAGIDYICMQFGVETEFKNYSDFENKIQDKNYVFKIGANS